MADISKIKPNGADGTEYDVKDATARSAIADKANNTQTFTEASTRANIASGENMATLFGKIKKFFSDLKTVAFTGSYSDLSGQPTIPAAVAVKGNAESTYRTGNVNLTPANIGALASNGTAIAATKATQDGDGNTISTTYMKKGVDYVTAGKSSSSTLGSNATAEGDIVTASGDDSHAEGYNTQAIGYAAHAEGYRTVSGATGSNNYGAHAEGYVTKGTGYASHAEGLFTEAKGMGAHAEGYGTIARAYQHVEGRFNVEDTNNVYAHIIGGGSDDNNKKNIFTVDRNGDVCAGRSNGLTNDLKLPTGADVISYLNSNIVNDSGWVAQGNLIYRKIGKLVHVISNGYPFSPTTTATVVQTLPEGFRPSQKIYTVGFCGAYRSVNMAVTIHTNGAVEISCVGNQNYGGFVASFFTD